MADGLTVGVIRETAPGERQVALVPSGAATLTKAGDTVLVESTAGERAFFPDTAYAEAGAHVVSRTDVLSRADVVLCLRTPEGAENALHDGQVLIGLLAPLLNPATVAALAKGGVTAVSLDRLPRTLSRAQSMDALTSQANIAGYKSVLVAASSYSGYFPMLMTAAGTVRPAVVLILGAGVAGLQAIGTAKRLGAVVNGYDVRPEARGDIESLGGRFLDLGPSVESSGGYARKLTDAEALAQQQALAAAIGTHDVVITTAQVPGARPPILVSAGAVAAMHAGSVIVDLAAGPLGGNVVGSVPDQTVVTDNGVTIIGAGNLPSSVPAAGSTAYSRNITALLAHLRATGALLIDTTDEIQAGVVITHRGDVVDAATAALLDSASSGGTS